MCSALNYRSISTCLDLVWRRGHEQIQSLHTVLGVRSGSRPIHYCSSCVSGWGHIRNGLRQLAIHLAHSKKPQLRGFYFAYYLFYLFHRSILCRIHPSLRPKNLTSVSVNIIIRVTFNNCINRVRLT